MKVKIKQDGIYSKFVGQKAQAQKLSTGAVVDFPKWYAESLIEGELAESATEHVKQLAATSSQQVEAEPKVIRRGRSKKASTNK